MRRRAAGPLLVLIAAAPHAWAHGPVHEQIAALTEQIRGEPGQAALYLQRAELHRIHQDFEAALADFDQAARLAPGEQVDVPRARVLLEAQRPALARGYLDRVLGRHPRHALALQLRGQVLASLGDHAGAARDLARAVELLPRPDADDYLRLARSLDASGRPAAAVAALERGLDRMGPAAALQVTLVEMAVRARAWDRALAEIEALMARSPRKESWLEQRGRVLLQAGRRREARRAFEEALAAVASLPPTFRGTPAMQELEARAREGLAETGRAPRGRPHRPARAATPRRARPGRRRAQGRPPSARRCRGM